MPSSFCVSFSCNSMPCSGCSTLHGVNPNFNISISISISIYLPIYLSIYIYTYIYLSIYLSIYLYSFLSVFLCCPGSVLTSLLVVQLESLNYKKDFLSIDVLMGTLLVVWVVEFAWRKLPFWLPEFLNCNLL